MNAMAVTAVWRTLLKGVLVIIMLVLARGSAVAEVGASGGWPAGMSNDWWSQMQQAIAQLEYHITGQAQTALLDPSAGSEQALAAAYQAPNRAHNFRAYFTEEGVRLVPRQDGASWQWNMALSGYGQEGALRPAGEAELVVEGNRIEYRREGLTEWYINSQQGLVHGFTLEEPAGGSGEGQLVVELALGGNLRASLSGDGKAVEWLTAGGVQVLRYRSLRATDGRGQEVAIHLSLARITSIPPILRVSIDTTDAVYPISLESVTSLAGWTAEGNQANASFGSSVATADDVNGDDFDDVIVDAPDDDNGQTDEGPSFLYHSSASGLSRVVDDPANGISYDGWLGVADGAASGGSYRTAHAAGRHLRFLSPLPDPATAWTAESNQDLAFFGTSVATAGDVNGDGYDDVIVGAYDYDNGQDNEGRAFVYYGSATGLSTTANWTAESNQTYAWFGRSVATAGDVNGDGYDDVIVGAPQYSNGQFLEGRALVYHGSATGLSTAADWTAESDQDYAFFGTSVATAGDVNGDGYSDVIVGAGGYHNDQIDEGRSYVYHGSLNGLSTTANWTAEGDQAFAYFGTSVATAGDVNGDGYSDVIVGAWGYDNGQDDEGRAFLYYGSVAGLSTTANWTAESDQASALYGITVSTAGDVNGDGYDDVIVGAYNYDNGQEDEGRSYVYHGSLNGLSTTANWTAEGDQAFAWFGRSVATAGDINGDGYDDVIVGAPRYRNGQTEEGRANVYHGSADTMTLTLITYRGPDQGMAEVTIDGQSQGVLVLYAPIPEYRYPITFSGLSIGRHLVTIEVLGQSNPASSGTEVRVDAFALTGGIVRQEDHPLVIYGRWTGGRWDEAYQGGLRHADRAGAVVSFPTIGPQFTWVTMRGPFMGHAEVLVDGAVVATVDMYSPTIEWQYPVVIDGLADTAHTVEIRALGTHNPAAIDSKVVFDAYSVP